VGLDLFAVAFGMMQVEGDAGEAVEVGDAGADGGLDDGHPTDGAHGEVGVADAGGQGVGVKGHVAFLPSLAGERDSRQGEGSGCVSAVERV
jgi:hypothetical protein